MLFCKSKENIFWNENILAKFKYQEFSEYFSVILNCTDAAQLRI